ncbi:MAG TPA: hypothetical protein DEV93_21875 [Chloroflexi bacterium]|nr:hypothetical protein [Chloroflexota bacterium]
MRSDALVDARAFWLTGLLLFFDRILTPFCSEGLPVQLLEHCLFEGWHSHGWKNVDHNKKLPFCYGGRRRIRTVYLAIGAGAEIVSLLATG